MVVVMKPTLACNAACRYCASGEGEDHARFPESALPELFRPFGEWLQAHPGERVCWIWHGGEPLLMGRAFYEAVVDAQRAVLGPDAPRIRNVVQSNLSLLTPEWIPTLRRLVGRGSIGTSFDPVPGWRLLGRGAPAGEAYDDAWLRGTELLRRSGVRYGTVYVVHSESVGRAGEMYRFFRNHDSGAGARFNPLYIEGRAEGLDAGPVSPEEYGRFLIDLFDAWQADGRRMKAMPLAEWLGAWQGEERCLCCDSRGSCAATHLGIAPDGAVYTCGRGLDTGTTSHGNILRDPLEAILAHPHRKALLGRAESLRSGPCAGCEWWELCHGGCPHDALLGWGDEQRETLWCESRQMLFAHMREALGPPEGRCASDREVSGAEH